MKKLISIIMSMTLLLSLCSCDRYVSSYSAIGLIRSQTSDSCHAEFISLNGQLVFKLKNNNTDKVGQILYSIKAEEGEINLYYDIDGEKLLLDAAGSEEVTVSGSADIFGNQPIYIIIEAKEKAKGSVHVELGN